MAKKWKETKRSGSLRKPIFIVSDATPEKIVKNTIKPLNFTQKILVSSGSTFSISDSIDSKDDSICKNKKDKSFFISQRQSWRIVECSKKCQDKTSVFKDQRKNVTSKSKKIHRGKIGMNTKIKECKVILGKSIMSKDNCENERDILVTNSATFHSFQEVFENSCNTYVGKSSCQNSSKPLRGHLANGSSISQSDLKKGQKIKFQFRDCCTDQNQFHDPYLSNNTEYIGSECSSDSSDSHKLVIDLDKQPLSKKITKISRKRKRSEHYDNHSHKKKTKKTILSPVNDKLKHKELLNQEENEYCNKKGNRFNLTNFQKSNSAESNLPSSDEKHNISRNDSEKNVEISFKLKKFSNKNKNKLVLEEKHMSSKECCSTDSNMLKKRKTFKNSEEVMNYTESSDGRSNQIIYSPKKIFTGLKTDNVIQHPGKLPIPGKKSFKKSSCDITVGSSDNSTLQNDNDGLKISLSLDHYSDKNETKKDKAKILSLHENSKEDKLPDEENNAEENIPLGVNLKSNEWSDVRQRILSPEKETNNNYSKSFGAELNDGKLYNENLELGNTKTTGILKPCKMKQNTKKPKSNFKEKKNALRKQIVIESHIDELNPNNVLDQEENILYCDKKKNQSRQEKKFSSTKYDADEENLFVNTQEDCGTIDEGETLKLAKTKEHHIYNIGPSGFELVIIDDELSESEGFISCTEDSREQNAHTRKPFQQVQNCKSLISVDLTETEDQCGQVLKIIDDKNANGLTILENNIKYTSEIYNESVNSNKQTHQGENSELMISLDETEFQCGQLLKINDDGNVNALLIIDNNTKNNSEICNGSEKFNSSLDSENVFIFKKGKEKVETQNSVENTLFTHNKDKELKLCRNNISTKKSKKETKKSKIVKKRIETDSSSDLLKSPSTIGNNEDNFHTQEDCGITNLSEKLIPTKTKKHKTHSNKSPGTEMVTADDELSDSEGFIVCTRASEEKATYSKDKPILQGESCKSVMSLDSSDTEDQCGQVLKIIDDEDDNALPSEICNKSRKLNSSLDSENLFPIFKKGKNKVETQNSVENTSHNKDKKSKLFGYNTSTKKETNKHKTVKKRIATDLSPDLLKTSSTLGINDENCPTQEDCDITNLSEKSIIARNKEHNTHEPPIFEMVTADGELNDNEGLTVCTRDSGEMATHSKDKQTQQGENCKSAISLDLSETEFQCGQVLKISDDENDNALPIVGNNIKYNSEICNESGKFNSSLDSENLFPIFKKGKEKVITQNSVENTLPSHNKYKKLNLCSDNLSTKKSKKETKKSKTTKKRIETESSSDLLKIPSTIGNNEDNFPPQEDCGITRPNFSETLITTKTKEHNTHSNKYPGTEMVTADDELSDSEGFIVCTRGSVEKNTHSQDKQSHQVENCKSAISLDETEDQCGQVLKINDSALPIIESNAKYHSESCESGKLNSSLDSENLFISKKEKKNVETQNSVENTLPSHNKYKKLNLCSDNLSTKKSKKETKKSKTTKKRIETESSSDLLKIPSTKGNNEDNFPPQEDCGITRPNLSETLITTKTKEHKTHSNKSPGTEMVTADDELSDSEGFIVCTRGSEEKNTHSQDKQSHQVENCKSAISLDETEDHCGQVLKINDSALPIVESNAKYYSESCESGKLSSSLDSENLFISKKEKKKVETRNYFGDKFFSHNKDKKSKHSSDNLSIKNSKKGKNKHNTIKERRGTDLSELDSSNISLTLNNSNDNANTDNSSNENINIIELEDGKSECDEVNNIAINSTNDSESVTECSGTSKSRLYVESEKFTECGLNMMNFTEDASSSENIEREYNSKKNKSTYLNDSDSSIELGNFSHHNSHCKSKKYKIKDKMHYKKNKNNYESGFSLDLQRNTDVNHSKKGKKNVLNNKKGKIWSSTPKVTERLNSSNETAISDQDSEGSMNSTLTIRDSFNIKGKLSCDNYSTLNKSAGLKLLEETMDKIQCQLINSEDELERLQKLKISITWELSPLHAIDNGSEKMSFNILKSKLGSENKYLSTKKFSQEEEEIIMENWNKFSKKYGFENPELFMSSKQLSNTFPLEERHNFKLFLARGLPNRRLFSVYRKFSDIYGTDMRGRWSNREDQLLLDLYHAYDEENGEVKFGISRHIMLQKALRRTWMSVHRRLQILLQDEQSRNMSLMPIEWSPEIEGSLVYYLLKKSKCKSVETLRYMTFEYKTWSKVARKLELPCDKVLDHWKYHLYPRLFARQTVFRHHLYIALISWFYDSDIKDWNDINWTDLSKKAGDMGSYFLYRCMRMSVTNFVPKLLHKNFRACVRHLYENYLPTLMEKEKSRVLKRCIYNPNSRLVTELEEDEVDCALFTIK